MRGKAYRPLNLSERKELRTALGWLIGNDDEDEEAVMFALRLVPREPKNVPTI